MVPKNSRNGAVGSPGWTAVTERATSDDARHRERPGALRPTDGTDTSELESERDLTCRDGALMLGASEFGCPNSGRPLASVPARMDPLGTAKFARLVRLNNQGILGERG